MIFQALFWAYAMVFFPWNHTKMHEQRSYMFVSLHLYLPGPSQDIWTLGLWPRVTNNFLGTWRSLMMKTTRVIPILLYAHNGFIFLLDYKYETYQNEAVLILQPVTVWLLPIGVRSTTSSNIEFIAQLMVNNNNIIEAQTEAQHTRQDLQGGNSVVVKLNKGDQVWVRQHVGSLLRSFTGYASSFSGVLLYRENW